METYIFIVVIFAIYWIYRAYGWIKFKNRYPILSSVPPTGILEQGDYVSLGNSNVRYLGITNNEGIYYVFEVENSLGSQSLSHSELIERLDAVYGQYGLKWKKVTS